MAKFETIKASNFPTISNITVEELQTQPAGHWVMVDCRSEAEAAVSVLPGTVSKEAALADPAALLEGKHVVAYCGIGGRSGKFLANDMPADVASKCASVSNFAGSTIAWAHAGLPFVDPKTGEDTNRVHAGGEPWKPLYPVGKGYEVVLH
jgi:rhodanese-related sulfurtransferase